VTQSQARHEQLLERLFLIDDEPGDRRMIGDQPAADHAERRIGAPRGLDPPA
jgi:hypothetical protein